MIKLLILALFLPVSDSESEINNNASVIQLATTYNEQKGQAMDKETQNDNEEVFGALYEPGGLYNDTLQQILQGLLSGIILHHGKLEQVTRDDILSGSNITAVTLEQYFKGTDAIMAEIYAELEKITNQLDRNMGRYRRAAVLHFLLENLRKQPLMLKVLITLDDRHFWEQHLRKIMIYITIPIWWDEEDEIWDELFDVFCYEFQIVLKWWSKLEFSEDSLEDAFARTEAWIFASSGYRAGLNFYSSAEES